MESPRCDGVVVVEALPKPSAPKWLETLLNLVVVGVAIVGIVAMQQARLRQFSKEGENPKQAEQQEALRLKLLAQAPTFGFDNLIADWAFLQFLQYYGDDPAREKTGYSLSPQYFDLITQRDPRFVDVYLFLSGTISYNLGEPELAIKMMRRGTEALSPQIHPKSFLVWRFMGLDQLLLLGDIPGSIKSHEMAATWAEGTPDANVAPVYRQTAAFLRTDPDSKLVRFQSWASIYLQALATRDKPTLARAKQEIEQLGGELRVNEQGQPYFALPNANQPKKPQ